MESDVPDSEGSVTHLIRRLKDGDDAALAKIFDRYYTRVVSLARRKLGTTRRMADEDDVAQTAFWGFYRCLREQRLPHLNNRHDLIGLLIVITARQAASQLAREMRQKRGGGHVVGESAIQLLTRAGGGVEIPDDARGPDEQVLLTECYERYMQALPQQLRSVAEDYLAGCSHGEIAARHQRSTRTADRWIRSIGEIWRQKAAQEPAW
ncbi:MAG: ECF-type sigma factor [Pirellulales bacterium]